MRGGALGPSWKLRLVRRDRARVVGRDPHHLFEVDGGTRRLGGFIEHHPYRDLGEHLATIDDYSRRFAEQAAAEGIRGRAVDLAVRPPMHFVSAYLLRGGFRDGGRGVALAWLGSAYVALKWARLREMSGS